MTTSLWWIRPMPYRHLACDDRIPAHPPRRALVVSSVVYSQPLDRSHVGGIRTQMWRMQAPLQMLMRRLGKPLVEPVVLSGRSPNKHQMTHGGRRMKLVVKSGADRRKKPNRSARRKRKLDVLSAEPGAPVMRKTAELPRRKMPPEKNADGRNDSTGRENGRVGLMMRWMRMPRHDERRGESAAEPEWAQKLTMMRSAEDVGQKDELPRMRKASLLRVVEQSR